jgi:hypothetical protein
MKSLHNVAVLVVVVALLGSIGIGASLQQQAFAQGIIVEYKEFTKLTNELEEAVLDAATAEPPEPDKIRELLDEYNRNVVTIFESDPPSETEPPDPDTEPPDPDTEPPGQSLKEPGKLEPPPQ